MYVVFVKSLDIADVIIVARSGKANSFNTRIFGSVSKSSATQGNPIKRRGRKGNRKWMLVTSLSQSQDKSQRKKE
jgi:hypothetical protein